jgi:uncharacterized protein YecE (DUF72 family)
VNDPGEVRVGTSGYSYQDWRGIFYPKTVNRSSYLQYYAQFLDLVEIDSTYYRIPHPSVMKSLSVKVPSDFTFTVKVPSTFTHQRHKLESTAAQFAASVTPLLERNLLGCFLAQFPGSFRYSDENLGFVEEVSLNLQGSMVAEFRHDSWQCEDAYGRLRRANIGLANVDLPRLKGLPRPSEEVTSKIAYVRFHGRVQAKDWWGPAQPYQRYNYRYSEEELGEWLPRIHAIRKKADVTYVLFNNHFRSQSIDNAQMLRRLLGLKMPNQDNSQSAKGLDKYMSA